MRNAASKKFFAKFQRDPNRHAKILARALRCEIRRIQGHSRIPYSPPKGSWEPKAKPVDYECVPVEYMYRAGKSTEGGNC